MVLDILGEFIGVIVLGFTVSVIVNKLEKTPFTKVEALFIAATRVWIFIESVKLGMGRRIELRPATLDKLLGFLVKDPEDVETEVGCLVEKRESIERKHGKFYAKLWFAWWGLWMIAKALLERLPGKSVVDALKKRLGAE